MYSEHKAQKANKSSNQEPRVNNGERRARRQNEPDRKDALLSLPEAKIMAQKVGNPNWRVRNSRQWIDVD